MRRCGAVDQAGPCLRIHCGPLVLNGLVAMVLAPVEQVVCRGDTCGLALGSLYTRESET
jgi:hypothetical protein